MSRWEQAFQEHPIHEVITQCLSHLDDIPADATPELMDELGRIKKFLNLVQSALKQVDPELTPKQHLDNLNSHFQSANFKNRLLQYSQQKNVAHLQNANNFIESHLFNLAQPLLSWVRDPSKLEIDREARDTLKKFVAATAEERDTLQTAYDEQTAQLDTLKQELAELTPAIEQLDVQQKNQMGVWQTEFDEKTQEWEDRFSEREDETINNFEERFAEAQRNHNETFDTWLTPEKERATTQINAFVSEYESSIDAYLTEAQSIKDTHSETLKTLTAELENLNSTVTQLDDEQKSQMEAWRLEFNGSATQRHNNFTQAQKDQADTFDDWFKSKTQEATAQIDNSFDTYEKATETYLANAEEKHLKICNLYGLVGRDSVIGGYSQNWESEKTSADSWRKITTRSIVVTIIWLLLAFIFNHFFPPRRKRLGKSTQSFICNRGIPTHG